MIEWDEERGESHRSLDMDIGYLTENQDRVRIRLLNEHLLMGSIGKMHFAWPKKEIVSYDY